MRSVTIRDIVPLSTADVDAHFVILRVEYTEGEPESYLIPIAFATGERAAQLSNENPNQLIANLEQRGGAGTAMIVIDALALPEFRAALLEAIGRRRQFRSTNGVVASVRTRAVYTHARGDIHEPLDSTLVRGEQSNSSIVYGDRFILKLYRKLEEGTSPELEIGRFLTERHAGSTNSPAVAGAIEYRSRPRAEPITLSVLHTYVRNEGDAWSYTLDELGRYFDHVLTLTDQSPPMPADRALLTVAREEVPYPADEAIGTYLESAHMLGRRTAELHLALASAMDEDDFAPEPFSAIYQRSLYHGQRAYAVQVLRQLRSALGSLTPDGRSNAEAVLGKTDKIMARFQSITRRRISAMRTRCHGDYHLGQVLHTGRDFVIVDFEGEPARSLGERRIKRSPLRDVAGMIRSFDYATHVAVHGHASTVVRSEDISRLNEWAQSWYTWVAGGFLRAYMEIMSDTPVLPSRLEDTRIILDNYILQKALYEVSYELNNRPDWVSVPLQGILQVLESSE